MRRRDFIKVIGGAVSTLPPGAHAQTPPPLIGFVWGAESNTPFTQSAVAALRRGLEEAGFVEGRNLVIEYHWAEGRYDRLPALLTDIVSQKVAIIAAIGAPAAMVAKSATKTIPIVFTMGEDPVSLGLVPSFNRPGGNITGVASLSSDVMAKRLELLREIAPRAEILAALINPKNPNVDITTKDAKDAARRLGRDIHIVRAGTESELDPAFAELAQLRAGALLIAPDGVFISSSAQIAALALRHAIPASHERRSFPDAGGLMSYGTNLPDALRLTGVLIGRILKGAKPADLPVQQPTKFELVINLKTAKALGLTVPLTLQASADAVIE